MRMTEFSFLLIDITFYHSPSKSNVTAKIFFCQQRERGSDKVLKYKDLYAWQLLNKVVRYFPSSSFVFVINCGLHMQTYNEMSKRLGHLLKFAKTKLLSLGKYSEKNKLIYRESSAQHFNNTAGYFVTGSKNSDSAVCVPHHDNISLGSEYDFRKKAERDVLSKLNITLVPFRKLTGHFYDIHPSSPVFVSSHLAASGRFRNSIDCTHFPYQYNVLYRILWFEILSA